MVTPAMLCGSGFDSIMALCSASLLVLGSYTDLRRGDIAEPATGAGNSGSFCLSENSTDAEVEGPVAVPMSV